MEKININNLEYLPKEHIYVYEGMVLPSVTEVMNLKFGDKYKDIPDFILEKAKVRGTDIHKSIETFIENGEYDSEYEEEVKNFARIIDENKFKVIDKEQPIIVVDDDKEPIMCGRFDVLVENEFGKMGLIDNKTTSVVDKNYLSYQLNTYKKGCEDTYGYEIDFLGCIWLNKKKNKYEYIEIDIDKTKVNELLFLLEMEGEQNEQDNFIW